MKNKNMKTIKKMLLACIILSLFSSVLVSTAYAGINENLFPDQSNFLISQPGLNAAFLEGSSILARVTDKYGNGIKAVEVEIIGTVIEGITDNDGYTTLTAPTVSEDTFYTIHAQKWIDGKFCEAFRTIKIRNKFLKIDTTDITGKIIYTVNEHTFFCGLVRDQDDQPVQHATVSFNGVTYAPGPYGNGGTAVNGMSLPFLAPWVSGNINMPISASKPGYDGVTKDVTIINYNDPLGHLIQGRVTDETYGYIENAKISCTAGGLYYETYTDSNGWYELSGVIPYEGGEYIWFKAEAEGFKDSYSLKYLSGDGNSISIYFTLKNKTSN